ncbi:serine/threonine-protein kinase [Streptomyces xylophagus]|uniref:serine/threonine-protein kinase n=1 Tax=Streptomyces xylophagus TaxID=285514 RepID=UPI0005B76FA0|nr:serine/threonine-protein kinase [Streptomyces xylophagus]
MEKLGAADPQRIGAYRLLARLGAGGMGHVYLARSDRGRTVAVKLVREELAAQEEFRARFRQEVTAARRVGGHWTAPVLDADTEAEVPWVATGYVAGPSLQQVVGRDHGALPERSVRILAAGLAHALQDIHAAGIVHRDLKPSNVLITIDGPRVIDFGIARALETLAGDGLTRTGSLVGSPGFMAPEQVRGDRITPACDVFCLGSVLAYAATGTLPFGAANSGVHALMFRIAQEEPDLSGVPEGIADLVRDCLRKDPAARPTLHNILDRTGAEDTVSGGRSRDPWLPGTLVAQLGRHAVRLLDTEDPETRELERVEPERGGSGRAGVGRGAPELRGSERGEREMRGSETPGPVTRGPEVPGLERGGPETRGPDVRGPEAPGLQRGGSEMPGSERVGPETRGPEKRELERADPERVDLAKAAPEPGAPAAPSAVAAAEAAGPEAAGPEAVPGAAPPPGFAPVAGQTPAVAAGQTPGAVPAVAAAQTPGAVPANPPVATPAEPPVPIEHPTAPVTPVSEASPEHAPASDDSSPMPPPPATADGGARVTHPPTVVADPAGAARTPAPPAPHPAYGYPQQHPQPAAGYGYPQQSVLQPAADYPQPPARQPVGWGGQVPYNPYPHNPGLGSTPPYGPGPYPQPQEPRRSGRSTALLVVVALVVALGAGGSVYALMKGGGNGGRTAAGSGGKATSAAPTTPGPTATSGKPSASASPSATPTGAGAVPSGYLGTWNASIDNDTGHNTRQLTIRQGKVGDPVLTLIADGPNYHCEFSADLAQQPGGESPLVIGASTVTSGKPLSSCNPGSATEITLLSATTLQRVNTSSGEKLTYTKAG